MITMTHEIGDPWAHAVVCRWKRYPGQSKESRRVRVFAIRYTGRNAFTVQSFVGDAHLARMQAHPGDWLVWNCTLNGRWERLQTGMWILRWPAGYLNLRSDEMFREKFEIVAPG